MSDYRIHGDTGEWEVVIGLEVHAQITSEAKLFSGASTKFGAEPNTQVSLVDAAMPGMLPVPNSECVRQAVRTGMAIDAQINKWSRFDRKNYFYADLPQGYQISQLYHPIVGEGEITVLLDEKDEGSAKSIGVERIHIEQDAGKLMHDQHPTMSYVDLNRSGVALMEIVSKPDMRSPAEAGAYVRKLRAILRYVGSCDGNMEEGSMRADVNVSVRKPGPITSENPLGTRTETKNVNSVRFVMNVIESEATRQVELIESGGAVAQETRLYDPDKNVTRTLRSKEDAHDYRYFPDPDLLPLELDDDFLKACRESLPELPDAMRQRFMREFGLSGYQASALVAEAAWARRFDQITSLLTSMGIDHSEAGKAVANHILNEIFGFLASLGIQSGLDEVTGLPVDCISPIQSAKLLKMRLDGLLSSTLYKQLFNEVVSTTLDPEEVAKDKGLLQTSDTGEIDARIDEILAANADKVQQFKDGKEALFGFFVGQTMKAMAGKANPGVVNERLRAKLG